MFYYKNKVKPIVILCAIIVVLAVAVSFCMWDDTSVKSLMANAGTADYTGTLPFPNGDYNTVINGVKYTVANQGTTAGGQKFVTLLSDDIGWKSMWRSVGGRHDGGPTAYTVGSTIAGEIQNYYNSVASKDVMYNGTSVGTLSSMVLGHQEGKWNMWLPSAREMQLRASWVTASYDSGKQPIMTYYSTDASRKYGSSWYWLRSPYSNDTSAACSVYTDGKLSYAGVHYNSDVVRVALNLKVLNLPS